MTLGFCDLEGCWEKVPSDNREPMFYDFDPEGVTEFCFCSKDHQVKWNKEVKYQGTLDFFVDDNNQKNLNHEFFERMFDDKRN